MQRNLHKKCIAQNSGFFPPTTADRSADSQLTEICVKWWLHIAHSKPHSFLIAILTVNFLTEHLIDQLTRSRFFVFLLFISARNHNYNCFSDFSRLPSYSAQSGLSFGVYMTYPVSVFQSADYQLTDNIFCANYVAKIRSELSVTVFELSWIT